MDRTQWIVVGTDFSEGAARALEQAVNLAARSGARIACVHSYEDPPGTPLRDDPAPGLLAQLEEAIAASGAHPKGVGVEMVVRRGPAWEKLINVASELGAGLIVVGASGERQSVRQFFLGTVASRLAAISTRLVLIVPPRLDVPQTFAAFDAFGGSAGAA